MPEHEQKRWYVSEEAEHEKGDPLPPIEESG